MTPSKTAADPRLKVVLPQELASNFFEHTGYVASATGDKRTRSRLRVRRGAQIEFPNLPNRYQLSTNTAEFALVKDLSNGGLAILYHESIRSGDVFRVFFKGREITAVAVRQRELGEKCHEIGARVLETRRIEALETAVNLAR